MVTVSPERPTVPLVQPVTVERSQEATVRDHDGQPLVTVELTGPLDGDELLIGEVDDPSLLMTYYFGRGGREVMLTLADHAVHARLETRWAGNHRDWWLEFED